MSSIHISIPEPCHENWHEMTPNEKGRFCQSCQKTVVDFTQMTNQQLYQAILHSGNQLCGHFHADQLNTPIYEKPSSISNWKRYLAGIVFPALLMSKSAKAQMGIIACTSEKELSTQPATLEKGGKPIRSYTISGQVVSEGSPVAFASVLIEGTNRGVQCDSLGRFQLKASTKDSLVSLLFSSIGFDEKRIMLAIPTNNFILSDMSIEVKKWEIIMTGEIVKVVSRKRIKKINPIIPKVKQVVKTIGIPIDTVSIFPNPVAVGSPFQAEVTTIQKGRFILRILSVEGRVVHQENLQQTGSKKRITVPTSSEWTTGIYLVELFDEKGKLLDTNRLLLQ